MSPILFLYLVDIYTLLLILSPLAKVQAHVQPGSERHGENEVKLVLVQESIILIQQ